MLFPDIFIFQNFAQIFAPNFFGGFVRIAEISDLGMNVLSKMEAFDRLSTAGPSPEKDAAARELFILFDDFLPKFLDCEDAPLEAIEKMRGLHRDLELIKAKKETADASI